MIKIVTTINNRRTAILAFERANLERLLDNQPVYVDLQALGQHADYDDPIQDVVVMAEETLQDVRARLISVGLPVPEFDDPKPGDPSVVKRA